MTAVIPDASRELIAEAVAGRYDAIKDILERDDVALVFGRLYATCPLLERLRGSDGGTLAGVSPERAASLIEPGDTSDLASFVTARGPMKIVVATRGGLFFFRFNQALALVP